MAAGVVALAPPALHAQATRPAPAAPIPLTPDRPGLTTGPALLASGQRQVETGYSFTRADDAIGHAVGEVLVRAALAPALELRVALNSYEVARSPEGRSTGLDDAHVGVKVRLAAGGDGPSLRPATALVAATSVPTGGEAFGRHLVEPGATLVAAWTLPRSAAMTVNLRTANRDRGDGVRAEDYGVNAALGWSARPRLGTYVEYARDWHAGHAGAHYLGSGIAFTPVAAAQLDAWTAVGVHRGAPDYRVGVGLARRF